tara:strand:+ start:191 stop:484 length:294 start_codon:yes stop_codon:yes gene_type:complete
MFIVDLSIIIVLSLVIIFEGMIIFYALRRINAYEKIFVELVGIIDYIKEQVDIIDNKGTFKSDDEVGFFWEAITTMANILNGLFENEKEEDAKDKEN